MTIYSTTRQRYPRCTIELLTAEGHVVPILDEGAAIEPSSPRNSRYREYWSEEEDLVFTFRHSAPGGDGSSAAQVEYVGDLHVNLGYELVVRERSQRGVLRVDYFEASPLVVDGKLYLDYVPKSVTVSGSLKRGNRLNVQLELQPGFSQERGGPELKWLRVRCD